MTLQEATNPDRWVSPDGMIDLRKGRWQDVLADVAECDAVITDPPYSARTHEGERGLRLDAEDAARRGGAVCPRNAIAYDHLTTDDVDAFVSSWAPRVRHWVVIFGDDVTCAWWREAWSAAGWQTFAPVVWRKRNPPPRFSGDGPTSSCEYIAIARPRRRLAKERMGSRPGDYDALTQVGRGVGASGIVGTKDPAAMRLVVGDYTLPGDLVVDPFCGWGTTALTCAALGRRCITSERMPETYRAAVSRCGGLTVGMARPGETPDLFAEVAS